MEIQLNILWQDRVKKYGSLSTFLMDLRVILPICIQWAWGSIFLNLTWCTCWRVVLLLKWERQCIGSCNFNFKRTHFFPYRYCIHKTKYGTESLFNWISIIITFNFYSTNINKFTLNRHFTRNSPTDSAPHTDRTFKMAAVVSLIIQVIQRIGFSVLQIRGLLTLLR